MLNQLFFSVAIFESAKPEKPDQIGYIDPACDVREIVVDAYENARVMCEQYYGDAPSLRLKCVNTKIKSENELENVAGENNEIRVAMVPLHLYYIMFELLKVRFSVIAFKNFPGFTAFAIEFKLNVYI